jgi:hypothetical protein
MGQRGWLMCKHPCTGLAILKGAQNPQEVASHNKNRVQNNLLVKVKSLSHVTTDGQVGQSVLVSSSIWVPRPHFCYCQTVAVLSMWRVLSDERGGPVNYSGHNQ